MRVHVATAAQQHGQRTCRHVTLTMQQATLQVCICVRRQLPVEIGAHTDSYAAECGKDVIDGATWLEVKLTHQGRAVENQVPGEYRHLRHPHCRHILLDASLLPNSPGIRWYPWMWGALLCLCEPRIDAFALHIDLEHMLV